MKTIYSIMILSVCAVVLTYCVGSFYAYFYPMKYSEEIVFYSKSFGIDAGLIASVGNVESNFNEKAVSNKGAIGIMQLVPTTAEWLAEKSGNVYSEEMLYDGEYNIKLGSFYLKYLLNIFNDEKTAICAYNAGQGNVANWLKNTQYSQDGKTLTKIPFKETRNYLSKVLKNYRYYKNRYKKIVN